MKELLATAVLISSCLAAHAHASAWPQPEGRGQVIVTGILSRSDQGFDANGDTVDISDYDKNEVYALVEYGISDDLTLMAIPSFSEVDVENGSRTSGLGYTELGARYRLASSGQAVFSFQGSIRIPGRKRRDGIAQADAVGTEVDLRGLAGTSFKVGGKEAFTDAQAGYRIRNGGPPNEFHIDLTFGVRPARKLLVLIQSFNVISDGSGHAPFSKYRYSNLSGSLVYDVTPKWSIQAGVIGTLAGSNALRERGVVVGLWRRF